MGNFFTNLQVRSSDKAEVVNALKQVLTAPAYVSRSTNEWVSAYPKEAEGSNFGALKRIAKNVSRSLETAVFCFLGYDDSIFVFSLYASGNLVGHFDSQLRAFGGTGQGFDGDEDASRPLAVASLMPFRRDGATEAELQSYIAPTRRYGFDVGEIASFAELLGIPEDRAVVGFDYVEEGDSELDNEAEEITLLQIGAVDTANDVKHPPEYWTKQLFEVGVSRSLDKLRLAIANGADPNGRDADGTTALILYSMHCLTDYMTVLIGAGADVNLMGRCDAAWSGDDLEEMTPLMAIASWSVDHSARMLDAARLLMNAGADIGLRSLLGRTALQIAEEMTDWRNWRARIGRHAPESLLRTAAHQSEQLVEMLKDADMPLPPAIESDTPPRYKQVTWWME